MVAVAFCTLAVGRFGQRAAMCLEMLDCLTEAAQWGQIVNGRDTLRPGFGGCVGCRAFGAFAMVAISTVSLDGRLVSTVPSWFTKYVRTGPPIACR